MIEPIDILKSYFQTGDVPTQDQFGNLIDSYVHKTEDGVTVFELAPPVPDPDPSNPSLRFGVGVTGPEARLGILADKLNGAMISFHAQPSPAAADWFINLASSANPGFRISEAGAGGENRLFIQKTSGYIGVGTQSPQQLLHLEGAKAGTYLGLQIHNLANTKNAGWDIGNQAGPVDEPTQNGDLSFVELVGSDKLERLTLAAGGSLGVGSVNPDTRLHVYGSYATAQSRIALAPNRGLAEIGQVESYNLVFDTTGLQARNADIPDPANPKVFVVKSSALDIQPLGGDILFHDKLTAPDDETKKGILTKDGLLGLGLTTPKERIDINGAIRIGEAKASNPGTIRYSNVSGAYDIEGFVNGAWRSLTGEGASAWATVSGGINYAGGNVGVGDAAPGMKLSVNGGIKMGTTDNAVPGTIRYSNKTTGLYDFEGCIQGTWTSLTAGTAGGSQWQDGSGNINYTAGAVGIGTTLTNALLHVRQNADANYSTAAIIYNDSKGDATPDQNRVGLEITSPMNWPGHDGKFDIGLHVSGVNGHPESQSEYNLAAILNGNVLIGNLTDGDKPVGMAGKNILAIKRGAPPTSPTANVQLYCDQSPNATGENILKIMNGNGNVIRLFKTGKLDDAITTPMPDAFELARGIIVNMRTRIDQLEARLADLGLIESKP